MIKQLKESLSQLTDTLKIQEDLVQDAIKKLPQNKQIQAKKLIQKAKANKLSIKDILNFTGRISKPDIKDIEDKIKGQ